MKIGIDLQTLETLEADRGIGRYARGLVENLARYCPHHTIVGFGFSDHPSSLLNCTQLPNFQYRRFDLPHPRLDYLSEGILAPFGWSGALRDLDAYIVTSPLMPDILLPDGAPFPIVALVHDLIPLLYRRLHPEQMSDFQWMLYDARLEKLADYDFWLTNSETTRRDVCRLLGLPPERVCPLGIGISEDFFDPPPRAVIRRIRERYAIRSHFVLSVTGHHYRKNWQGVFESFAALPAALRRSHQLVVTCRLDAPSRDDFIRLADRLGILRRVVLTDAVDDEGLRVLYHEASALLFPSFCEGFGIPLIEAMAAGLPIVASDIESFRETAGDAALLADPARSDLMAEQLKHVLHDKNLRRRLIEAGRCQVERYRWPAIIQTADRLLSDTVCSPAPDVQTEKPRCPSRRPPFERVAYFTLLPPQVSGIADYNESLVRELAKHVQLELFLENITPSHPEIREHLVWRSSRQFARLHRDHPYDLIVYHIGNNVLHGRQYRMAVHFPGIVMLHDYCLRLFAPLSNRQFSFLETHDDIEHYYGRSFPRGISPEHLFAQLDLLDHPLNERLIESALGLMVHSQWSRNRIHRRFPDKPVEVVPFGVDPDPRPRIPAREEIRRRYHIPPDAFVVTCAGNLTPMKRLTTILYAFSELADRVPDAVLCLVGQASDPRYFQQLHRRVGELRLAGAVRFLGYVTMEELYDVVDMSDVCLNLRYPTLGETSAVLFRMMQLGKPVLVSSVAQFLEFPDTVCWKVDVEGAERLQLVRYLRLLHRAPDVRRTLGENARRYVQHWTWDKIAPLHVEAWQRILHSSKRA